MKNRMSYNIIVFLFGFSLFILGCSKDLPTIKEIPTYTFANIDKSGGTWKPILINDPSTLVVNAPVLPNTSEFDLQLADLKTNIAALTDAERANLAYWGNNPIIRWNEIARDLAAKYNLTPAPNPDGSYPSPSAANPGVYPYFPFAHPPYTCRMLAYLSAAQYDGMILAWHYKYTFNREGLHKVDQTIAQAFPANELPSYPSQGAVTASISFEILKAMFPLEVDYLNAKLADALKSESLCGEYLASDVASSVEIGKLVSTIFLTRASSDGMKNAQTNKVVFDSLKLDAKNKYGWTWNNLESPVRPVGITPYFGKVKPWSVPNIAAIRPSPPPAIGSSEFNEDVEELENIANNLTDEQRKIANWWSDGLGTYTPPGHWNRFAADFIVKYKMNPIRAARTMAYMNMAIMDAGISCWDAKYHYFYPRPIQSKPGFKTILGTPNFPSYTSGHSTFSAAAAEVLAYIFPAEKAIVDQWAHEAGLSRIYGGIHYRFDSEVGLAQGKTVATFTIEKAKVDGAD